MSRMKRQAAANRQEAELQRIAGNDAKAARLEQAADQLDSGRVKDQTEAVSGLIGWAFGRKG